MEDEVLAMPVIKDVDGGEWIPVNAQALYELVDRYRALGPIDHLRELVQAEKAGRLVVLPFIAMIEQSLQDGEMKPYRDQRFNGRYAVVYSDKKKWAFPLIDICGTHYDRAQAEARLPAVTIAEADNTVYQKMRTTAIENAAQLMYEVNVYSNKVGYKKMEAKTIMSIVDREFARLGFTRTMCNPVPNLQDATIFRLTARYEAVAVPEGAQEETVRIYTQ